jgi:purine-cytosine permease-like protein
MKFLKLVLLGILVVFLAFIGMKVLGVAFRILMSMFWLALIGLAALAVWKMFSSKGTKQMETAEPKNKFENGDFHVGLNLQLQRMQKNAEKALS